ncbi:hypothetical protein F7734_11445 [Scytonema sp. UIC 10036]|uniref:hypothetical protein n=1 Tax=Scytonema sp. UIC 10036 TaxID=2304196 RepID=UPI0012DACC9D|nr:hypothetical protein [Scytonema sp. UIC 10036]MUG93018.1 hypothetical protein [Scytonema sp. UIC 10036]
MENFSGYNRDKREFLARPGHADALEETERKELRDRTLELTSSESKLDKIGDELIQLLEQSQAKTIHEFVLSLNLSHPASTVEEFTEKFITYLEMKDRKDLLIKYK